MRSKSPNSLRRVALALALVLLAMGCKATSDPATGDLRLDLHHRDPRVRMQAAFLAVEKGRRDLEGELVENLSDVDESVRFISGIALKRLTGQDFGYLSYGEVDERAAAIARWKKWLGTPAAPEKGRERSEADPRSTGFSSAEPSGGRRSCAEETVQ
jgi:hypothetical protein